MPVKRFNPHHKTGSAPLQLSLPTEKSKPSNEIADYSWLFYGEKKIGKTSLLSQFPQTLCLMFEPGGKSLAIYQKSCQDWKYARGYADLLFTTKHKFINVGIDTGTIAYGRCLTYVCKDLGIKHPGGQKDYGQSWAAVSKEFEEFHTRLMSKFGMVVTAHVKTKHITTLEGEEFDQIVPLLSSQAEEYYSGVIDTIGYFHYEGRERFLTIRGDSLVVAGTRCENNFLSPSGEPVYKIPMGKNPKEAYHNLVEAFNNQQKETYLVEEVKHIKKSFKRNLT